jgi:polyisoprenoid-binding protein YceI
VRPYVPALGLLFLFAFTWSCLSPLGADPKQAGAVDLASRSFEIDVYKSGFARAFAHDHVMGVTRFSGQVTYDANEIASSRVELEVDAAALAVQDRGVSAKDRRKIKRTMDSKEILDVARYPKIRFRSSAVRLLRKLETKPGDPPQLLLEVTGKLTLHGVTRELKAPVRVTVAARAVTAEAQLRFKQSLFGMKPYSAMLGAVGVKDEVRARFRIVSARP